MLKIIAICVVSLFKASAYNEANYETSYLNGNGVRDPTWEDWEELKEYWFGRILGSTCPKKNSDDLTTHWDYNYDQFLQEFNGDQVKAKRQDCELFKRERNPRAMGSRLIRHAFHDSAGGFDGFVNIHNESENGGLFSSQKVLLDAYDSLSLSNDGNNYPVDLVLSFADFSAWAAQAALLRAAYMNGGQGDIEDPMYDPQGWDSSDPDAPYDGDIGVTISWGRLSYLNDTEADEGPIESFPGNSELGGALGPGDNIVDFFEEQYGFDARQTVTLLGIHTFGGARKTASGFFGMWTQTKNRLNNDYQKQLIFPLPVECTIPENGQCDYISDAEDDIDDVEGMQNCKAGHVGRCQGWQQVRVAPVDEFSKPKFQWRHMCRDDDGTDGCNHLMLNSDLGLMYNIAGYICTALDELNGELGTRGRICEEGMIKDYPPSSSCDRHTSRVLATCFPEHEQFGPMIRADAGDFDGWITDFSPLFNTLLEHRLRGDVSLQILSAPPSQSPTSSPTVCSNDMDWITDYNNVDRNCNFVANDPGARCSLQDSSGVPAAVACPVSCSTCGGVPTDPTQSPTSSPTECSNDMDWITNYNSVDRNCHFVANDPGARCSLQDSSGVPAAVACPIACSTCP